MRRQQSACAAQATVRPLPPQLTRAGGIDVSFSEGKAFVTLVCLGEGETPEWHVTMAQTVRFPYVSGYLAFRELPLAIALLRAVAEEFELPPVLLVDGSGMLHPRRCGIATMLGVYASIPTIGITKKLLCGAVDESTLAQRGTASVVWEGEPLGTAARMRGRSRRPIYVSPGHQ
ncbi:MAG: endonuclease V, partial [Planctomycetota bacterium]